ncbi:MAG: hypothetical protein UU16_C0009G0008 [Candidatus Woesebacteria bacterium GW2011_GWA2_40_7]|uniref:HD domain-containing protein n=3 Tax=Candidatus Woeseibacteriota TaxID=1752722 RepID=A0A0G0P1C2_9BACT|nr:MAG: hypothetical protein UT17_C0004G0272 [Candidatus Woesebacteria bacterium GW2011_GWB1_39_10]KKR73938.1 MAG: hypothetical protein UU16_C0009G0008 [Candidatus Woesebacteria bacterium GW2011_GWA2_40_7]KKS90915.1 MAG: hypothetical protein UV66_C0001G0272 [Candidatus Woesebacteria bacterium GW2011_GWA1_43_12]
MISKEKALELLHSKMQSQNLRKHCYSVGAVMRSLASRFQIPDSEAEKWYIVGLLHDGDYEFTKEDSGNHARLMASWVREIGETNEELLTGIESHGWFHQGKKPQTKMQWALFCCDELTGLIIAVTLVRPDKKLATVTVDNILSKWNQKSFAARVKREDIENCEKELDIPLKDFIQIALTAMQGVHEELGL